MKNIKFLAFAFILFAMIGFQNSSIAQEEHMGKGKNCMHQKENCKDQGCCNIPDLTDEQKTKIEKMKMTHMKDMMQLKNQMAEKKAHKKTLMTADKVDMVEINKAIDEIGAINVTIMKKEAEHIQAVRALLTDEQRTYFDMHHGNKMKHKMQSGMQGKMDHKCMPK